MILGNFSFQKNLKSDFFYKIRKFGKLIVNDLVNHYFTFILHLVLNCFWLLQKSLQMLIIIMVWNYGIQVVRHMNIDAKMAIERADKHVN